MSIVEIFLKFSKESQAWASRSCRKCGFHLLFFLLRSISAFCPSPTGLFIRPAALALSIVSCTIRSHSRHWGHLMLGGAEQWYLIGEMCPFHGWEGWKGLCSISNLPWTEPQQPVHALEAPQLGSWHICSDHDHGSHASSGRQQLVKLWQRDHFPFCDYIHNIIWDFKGALGNQHLPLLYCGLCMSPSLGVSVIIPRIK